MAHFWQILYTFPNLSFLFPSFSAKKNLLITPISLKEFNISFAFPSHAEKTHFILPTSPPKQNTIFLPFPFLPFPSHTKNTNFSFPFPSNPKKNKNFLPISFPNSKNIPLIPGMHKVSAIVMISHAIEQGQAMDFVMSFVLSCSYRYK